MQADGEISIDITSGNQPIMFSLNGGPQQAANTFTDLETGDYTLSILDANGCITERELTIQAAEEIAAEIIGDFTIQYGDDVSIDTELSNTIGEVTLLWDAPTLESFSCLDCLDPVISNITESFSASLVVQDERGCSKETFVNINIVNEVNLEVPTGFSPNGDGNNDVLSIFGNPNFTITSFSVYNRTGQKIYEGQGLIPNEAEGWDGRYRGTLMPTGSYVWTIDYIDVAGKTGSTRGVTTLIK